MSHALHFPPDYSDTRVLGDGTEVTLRLQRPQDRELLLKGFEELSEESRYRRFFSAMPHMPESIAEKLLATDDWNHLAILAFTSDGHAVASARFIRLGEDSEVAEAATAVVDSMQGRGLGKLLTGLVAQAARERGVKRFRAHVLSHNDAMIAVLREINPNLKAEWDGHVVTYELELPELEAGGDMTGAVFDVLRAAGRGLQHLLHNLRVTS